MTRLRQIRPRAIEREGPNPLPGIENIYALPNNEREPFVSNSQRLEGLSLGGRCQDDEWERGMLTNGFDELNHQTSMALSPDEDLLEVRLWNLQQLPISYLRQVKAWLASEGYLCVSEAALEADGLDRSPEDIWSVQAVRALALFQWEEMLESNGKVDDATYAHLKGEGVELQIGAGEHEVEDRKGEAILPDSASEAMIYAYMRDAVMDRNGVWSDEPGHINLVGVRGLAQGDSGWEHVENLPNRFNDTLLTLYVDESGAQRADLDAATTEPGTGRGFTANLVDGTHAYEVGSHNGREGLNPQYDHSAVYRWNAANGQSYETAHQEVSAGRHHPAADRLHGLSGAGRHRTDGSSQNFRMNIHGSPFESEGKSVGGKSAGCQVLANASEMTELHELATEAQSAGQQTIYYTLLDASSLEILETEALARPSD